MITSLIEMLELPNFSHLTTSTVKLKSCDKIFLVTSWAKIMTSYPFFQITFVLRRPRVDNFADIIEIETTFIKITLKDSKN